MVEEKRKGIQEGRGTGEGEKAGEEEKNIE